MPDIAPDEAPPTPVRVEAVDSPRRRIRDAAVELFFHQRYRGTSVRDITLACALTPGALYNHYPSKEDLLFDIIASTHDELEGALEQALDAADDTPEDRLYRLVEAFARFHIEHHRPALIANLDYVELTDDRRNEIIERRRTHRRHFEEQLAAGVAAGTFTLPAHGGPNVVKIVATALGNLALRLSEMHGPQPDLDIDALAALHAELALRMVGAEPPRSRS